MGSTFEVILVILDFYPEAPALFRSHIDHQRKGALAIKTTPGGLLCSVEQEAPEPIEGVFGVRFQELKEPLSQVNESLFFGAQTHLDADRAKPVVQAAVTHRRMRQFSHLIEGQHLAIQVSVIPSG